MKLFKENKYRTYLNHHPVSESIEIFYGVGAVLTKRFQAKIKGHGCSTGQDALEFINEIVCVHERESAHE